MLVIILWLLSVADHLLTVYYWVTAFPRTVLLLVKVLVEYCHYADSLPVLINEVMTKLIDLIKVSTHPWR